MSTDVKHKLNTESIESIEDSKRNLFEIYEDLLVGNTKSKYEYNIKHEVLYLIYYYDYIHSDNKKYLDTNYNIFRTDVKVDKDYPKSKIHFYLTLTHPDDINKTMIIDIVYKELDEITPYDDLFEPYSINIKIPSTYDNFNDNLLTIYLFKEAIYLNSNDIYKIKEFGKDYINVDYLANNGVNLAYEYIERESYKHKEAKIDLDDTKLTKEEIDNIYKYRDEVYEIVSKVDLIEKSVETKEEIYNQLGNILPALEYLLKYRDYGSINMKICYCYNGFRHYGDTVDITIYVPKADIKDLNNKDDFVYIRMTYELLDKVSKDNEYAIFIMAQLERKIINAGYDIEYNKEQVKIYNQLGKMLITEDYLKEFILVNDNNEILNRRELYRKQEDCDKEMCLINSRAKKELYIEQIDNIKVCKEALYETLSMKIKFIHYHNGPKLHTSLLYLLQKRDYKTLEITTDSYMEHISDDIKEPKFIINIILYKPITVISSFECDVSNSRKLVLKYKNRKEPYKNGYIKLENISFVNTGMPTINRHNIDKVYRELYDNIGNELLPNEYIQVYIDDCFKPINDRNGSFPNIDILFEDKNK